MVRYDLRVPLEGGVEAVASRIRFGAGTLGVDAKPPTGLLAAGTLEYEQNEPHCSLRAGRGESVLEIEVADRPWHLRHGGGVDWDVHLAPEPVYNALRFDIGACRCRLDLTELKIKEFEFNTGASKATITLGDHGLVTRAYIQAGAAELTLRVPNSLGVKVRASGALAKTNLGAGTFVLGQTTWASPGYEGKTSRLDLDLRAGATSFSLEWIG